MWDEGTPWRKDISLVLFLDFVSCKKNIGALRNLLRQIGEGSMKSLQLWVYWGKGSSLGRPITHPLLMVPWPVKAELRFSVPQWAHTSPGRGGTTSGLICWKSSEPNCKWLQWLLKHLWLFQNHWVCQILGRAEAWNFRDLKRGFINYLVWCPVKSLRLGGLESRSLSHRAWPLGRPALWVHFLHLHMCAMD